MPSISSRVVDVTFGDVVRAIVTADRSLYPQDEAQLRATLVESLRRRGIYPTQIASLADEALTWSTPRTPLKLTQSFDVSKLIHSATQDLDPTSEAGPVRSEDDADLPEGSPNVTEQYAPDLTAWAQAKECAIELGLDPDSSVQTRLSGLHVVYPRAADGQPRPQIVLQFLQRRRDLEDATIPEQLRVPIRAGTTVIARVDGTVDRIVAKPLPLSNPGVLADADLREELRSIGQSHHEAGKERLCAIQSWIADLQQQDALAAWTTTPALTRLTFAQLHSPDPPERDR